MGVDARAEIVNSAGRHAEAILDAADELDADLLVAGFAAAPAACSLAFRS